MVVDFHRGALRQPADGAGRPVEADLEHRLEKAALTRADGLGQRAVLQLDQRRHGAGDGFQSRLALQGGQAGFGMVHQVAHA